MIALQTFGVSGQRLTQLAQLSYRDFCSGKQCSNLVARFESLCSVRIPVWCRAERRPDRPQNSTRRRVSRNYRL